MTRCELVRCTACKAACIRKGRENQQSKTFANLNNLLDERIKNHASEFKAKPR